MDCIHKKTVATDFGETGVVHASTTYIIHELEDEEITDSDPELISRVHNISISSIQYDINDTEEVYDEEMDHIDVHGQDPMEDNWFPSLSKTSQIHDLDKTDNGDHDMFMIETYATDILDDDDDGNLATKNDSSKNSRWISHVPTILDPMETDDYDDVIRNHYYGSRNSNLVPLHVAYE